MVMGGVVGSSVADRGGFELWWYESEGGFLVGDGWGWGVSVTRWITHNRNEFIREQRPKMTFK